MIRKLIKRMLDNGQLKPEKVRSTVERYKNATEGETYYLGEFASLKVTTKSETAKADEITDEIINVFIDARKGVQPAAPENSYPYDLEFQIAEVAARMLRMSDTSKMRMLASICEIKGVSSAFLPSYANETLTRAITALLKDHGSPLSAKAVNLALLGLGILETLERTGSKGDLKTFKSLTDAGLKYGRNETSQQNPRETSPLYFAQTFPELLDRINAHLRQNPQRYAAFGKSLTLPH